ncbi:hypothetical protein [Mycobacterium sp.]|uniref:hypothetical protein n=1 Tax=Mycobacterium sp. TaxID=1785 RepID=UPI0025F692BA|nr:hypothetical protein [Mycobacterium sp.]
MTTPSLFGQWAEQARRLVNQAGGIVLQANTQINNGTFSTEKWAQSTQQLVNLVLTAGLEMNPVPCLPHIPDARDLSDFIKIDPDNEFKRTLSIAKPFVQDGAPACIIPAQSTYFVPPVVRIHATSFRVGVNWPNLSSGTYRGRVRLTQIGCAEPYSVEKDVIIDL